MAYNNQPDWETYITKPKTIKFRLKKPKKPTKPKKSVIDEIDDLMGQLANRFEEKRRDVSMSQDEKDLIDFMCGNKNSNGKKQFNECISEFNLYNPC